MAQRVGEHATLRLFIIAWFLASFGWVELRAKRMEVVIVVVWPRMQMDFRQIHWQFVNTHSSHLAYLGLLRSIAQFAGVRLSANGFVSES
jgi:hypothetical protein